MLGFRESGMASSSCSFLTARRAQDGQSEAGFFGQLAVFSGGIVCGGAHADCSDPRDSAEREGIRPFQRWISGKAGLRLVVFSTAPDRRAQGFTARLQRPTRKRYGTTWSGVDGSQNRSTQRSGEAKPASDPASILHSLDIPS